MNQSLSNRLRRLRPLFLLAATGLGAFLRLYRLESLPPAASFDAAQYGLDALQILDGARPIFLAANFGREPLFSYLTAAVYGAGVSGALGIHLASALIGIATIPAVAFAAREVLAGVERAEAAPLRDWTPLLAAFITAVSYWHLNYSRAGLRVIWVPLFAALISAFLWRGLRRGGLGSFAAAGLLLGLSQYTYQAARLLPLLVAGGFAAAAFYRRGLTRRELEGAAVCLGLALLVFAPLGVFAVRNPGVFNDRLRQTALIRGQETAVEQVQALGAQAGLALRMFFIEGDHEPLYTIPGRPALDPFLALTFLGGVAAALWHWRRPEAQYLLLWLALMTAPAMIADQAATGKRALGAMPAAAILAATGLVAGYAVLLRRAPRWAAPYLLLAAAALAWSTAQTYRDYFDRWGTDPALPAHFQRDHTEVGLAAGRYPDDAVLVSPFAADHPALVLNSGRHPDLRSYNGHRCLLLASPAASDVTYLIVPGETETSVEQLLSIYPDLEPQMGPRREDREEPYYMIFRVGGGLTPQTLPKEPVLRWAGGIELLDTAVSPEIAAAGESIVVTLTYKAAADQSTDYTAYVHLLAPGGTAAPAAQADSEPCGGSLPTSRWLEGDIVRDRITLSLPGDLAAGEYRIATGFYTWPDLKLLDVESGAPPIVAEVTVR